MKTLTQKILQILAEKYFFLNRYVRISSILTIETFYLKQHFIDNAIFCYRKICFNEKKNFKFLIKRIKPINDKRYVKQHI